MPKEQQPHPPAAKHPERVQEMFGRIVPRYDLMNRVMSGGMDGRWRRLAAGKANPRDARILDLGTGTGDFARELRRQSARQVVGADFTRGMLTTASLKPGLRGDSGLSWVQADVLQLPFPNQSFDAVTSGFLLRNLADLQQGLNEMLRVLVPGGRFVSLDITHPPQSPLGSVLRFGFQHVVTPIAGLISGDRSAYSYLPSSLEGYPAPDELAAMLETAGAIDVGYQRLGGGSVALHFGHKPPA
jgi:demethylmenaquinone methyltransferase/2-methoxy-6-polyprenyl-1,4-benzoquinol methylase